LLTTGGAPAADEADEDAADAASSTALIATRLPDGGRTRRHVTVRAFFFGTPLHPFDSTCT
jgi:hypothetical protein